MILENGHQFAHAMEIHYCDTIYGTDEKHEPLFLFFDSKSAASKLSALSLGWMLKALDIAFTFHDLNDPSAIARVDISPDQSPVFIGFLRGVTDESIRLFSKNKDPKRNFVITDSCTFLKDKKSEEPIIDVLSKISIVIQGAYMPPTTVTALITPLPNISAIEDETNPSMVIAQCLYNYAHNPIMSPIYKRRFRVLPTIIDSIPMSRLFKDPDEKAGTNAFQLWHDGHHEDLIAMEANKGQ